MQITVLSPHRDDAAFSVGLTIGLWLNMGHDVAVVNCFTKSEFSPRRNVSAVEALKLQAHVTAMRHEEDLTWSNIYPRALKLIDLHLVDAPVRRQCRIDEVCITDVDDSDAAIAEIRMALEEPAGDALVLPLGIGNHVDHLTTRIAAQGSSRPESLPLAFYEDLPYSTRPGAIETIHLRASEVAQGLESQFASEPGDVRAAVERKRQLALCYSSQIDDEGAEQIANFCEQYRGRERLWVNQAWRSSALRVAM